eukprot:358020-Chlamydomonas_euryale.AAC.13
MYILVPKKRGEGAAAAAGNNAAQQRGKVLPCDVWMRMTQVRYMIRARRSFCAACPCNSDSLTPPTASSRHHLSLGCCTVLNTALVSARTTCHAVQLETLSAER